jgi:chorismate dehydratase
VALTRILLKERFGLEPRLEPLAIGSTLADTTADAVVLIGDRGIAVPKEPFEFIWDLGQEWCQWSGLPFVFAMWIARPDLDLAELDTLFATARDEGLLRLEAIARQEYARVGISYEECLAYFRENLTFCLGPRQRQGLDRFYQLAVRHQLAPIGADRAIHDHPLA